MGVSHRSLDITMPHQFLHGPRIDSFHDPLTCAEVTKVVKPDPFQTSLLSAGLKRAAWLTVTIHRIEASEDIRTSHDPSQRP